MTSTDPSTARTRKLSPLALALAATAGAYGSLDSMLNVAFPDLIGDLGIAVVDIQWLVVAFVLASGGTLIGAGRLGDLLGHHRTLSWGGLASAAGMAVCAAAPNLAVLVVGRVLQGLGTAFVMASAPALIAASAGEGGRGRALGLFQMSAAVGLALGPLAASPLVAALGWRSVFWTRAPIGIALGLLARRQARHTPAAGQVALGGPALLAATLATVLVALNLSLRLGVNGPVIGLALGGATLAVVLTRHQRRADDPVIALDLLRRPAFLSANLLAVTANGAAFVGWLFVPTYLVDELGRSTFTGGVVLAATPAATALIAPVAGRLSDRWGPATVAAAGLVVLTAGLVTGGVVAPTASVLGLGLAMALVGMGVGLFTVPNMAYVFASLPADRQGVAGGVTQTMRTMGIVVGVGLLSRFFAANQGLGFGRDLGRTFLAAAVVTGLGAVFSGLRAWLPVGRRGPEADPA